MQIFACRRLAGVRRRRRRSGRRNAAFTWRVEASKRAEAGSCFRRRRRRSRRQLPRLD